MAMRDFVLDFIEEILKDKTFNLTEEDLRFYEKGTTAEDDEGTDQQFKWQNARYYNVDTNVTRKDLLLIRVASDGLVEEILTFRVAELYNIYLKLGMDAALKKLKDAITEARPASAKFLSNVIMQINDLNALRDYIILRPLNYDNNELFLRDGVYRRVGDMALVLYIGMGQEKGQFISFKVAKDMLKEWGVEEEPMLDFAMENTMRLQTPMICALDFSNGLSLKKVKIMEKDVKISSDVKGFHVLTTDQELNGAIAGFYAPVQERLYRMIHGEYYMVFDSIHTVHIHPVRDTTLSTLRYTLKGANRDMNRREEVLSRKIYRYDRRKRGLVEAR